MPEEADVPSLTREQRDALDAYVRHPLKWTSVGSNRILKNSRFADIDADRGGKRIFATLRDNAGTEVLLRMRRDGTWTGECSCYRRIDCGHCLALARTLLEAAPVVEAPVSPAKKTRKDPDPIAGIPPESLVAILQAGLGRGLTSLELGYAKRVVDLYAKARKVGGVQPHEIRSLAAVEGYTVPFDSYFYRDAEPVWRDFPATVTEFWQAIAWQARRSGVVIPGFMEQALRNAAPSAALSGYWRKLEVDEWIARLRTTEHSVAEPPAEPNSRPLVDFRLMLVPGSPELQMRTMGETNWVIPKKTPLKRMIDEYSYHGLPLVAGAEPLWDTLHRLVFLRYGTELSYGKGTPFPAALISLLRLSSLQDRIVSGTGVPMERMVTPLRWVIHPPEIPSGDYRFELGRPDGQPLTGPVTRLEGRPDLILTPTEIWHAPPIPPGFNLVEPTLIPAPAVESEPGLKLLASFDTELPLGLQERILRVPLQPVIRASLIPGNDHRGVSERLLLEIEARENSGRICEKCLEEGWKSSLRHKPQPGQLIVHQRDALGRVPALVESLGARWDIFACGRTVRVTANFAEKFTTWVQELPPSIILEPSDELKTLLLDPVEAGISLNCQPAGVDWFDLTVAVQTDGTDLTQEELKLLLGARGGYVRLGAKGWRRITWKLSEEDEQQLARLGLNPRELDAEPQRLHALQLADPANRRFLPEAQAESIERRAGEIQARVTPAVPGVIRAELRPYQVEGFHFLAYLSENRFGGVLADDMGLGKTVQTLAWIAWLRARCEASGTPPGRILILCPKSVAPNWESEAERFLPGLRVTVWRGEKTGPFGEALAGCDALVLNYPQLRVMSDQISRERWLAVIADEAQMIKNPDSQTAQVSRGLTAEHRLALTGTPIENRLLDLWSIMAFAMPGALGPRAQFQRSFGKTADAFARRRLSARLRPFLLRRTKGQVAQDLPDRIEEDLACELEGIQQTLYRAEYKKARALLLKIQTSADLDQFRFHFLTSLLRLRQICCHAALVDASQEAEPSAKVDALLDLVEPLIEEGHKVLVFSQFVTMLDLLRKTVRGRGWTDFFLAGDTEDRGELVKEFNTHEGAAVFLISLKAGGFGLNLTSASYVVLFDPWWNPAVEAQAIDRTHRIGQVNTVIAYRLIVKGSVEEKIRALQKQKQLLVEDILGDERFSQSLTLEDLKFLFSGAEAGV